MEGTITCSILFLAKQIDLWFAGTVMEVYVVIQTAYITDLFKRIFENDINISKNLLNLEYYLENDDGFWMTEDQVNLN